MHVCYIPTLSILTGLLFSHMDDILQNSYTQCRLKEANMCLCVRKKLKYELSTLIMFIEGKKNNLWKWRNFKYFKILSRDKR